MFKTTMAIMAAASVASLVACVSKSATGSGAGTSGDDDDAAAQVQGGSNEDASAGGTGCSQSQLAPLVGSPCASCVASMCSDVLSECTTSCAHCAASLIVSCGDCASACIPADSGSKAEDASTGAGTTDAASAQSDGGAPTCAKLSACCAQVAAFMASEGTDCTQAVADNNEAVCASVYMQVKALDPFCM